MFENSILKNGLRFKLKTIHGHGQAAPRYEITCLRPDDISGYTEVTLPNCRLDSPDDLTNALNFLSQLTGIMVRSWVATQNQEEKIEIHDLLYPDKKLEIPPPDLPTIEFLQKKILACEGEIPNRLINYLTGGSRYYALHEEDKNVRCVWVWQGVLLNERQILSIDNLGYKSLKEWKKILNKYGLTPGCTLPGGPYPWNTDHQTNPNS